MKKDIYKKLDLEKFILKFNSYFARNARFEVGIDLNIFKSYLDELDKVNFTPPKAVLNLQDFMLKVQKQGILKLDEIFEFIKIIKYFLYLKSLNLKDLKYLPIMLEKIIIPSEILKIEDSFEVINDKFSLKNGIYLELDLINKAINSLKLENKKQMDRILQKEKLSPFIIDRQIHLIDSKECLLLKAGFSKVLEGRIINRTQAGYFYVLPKTLQNIYERLENLYNKKEILIYKIEKNISSMFLKHILFLKFIDREFDKFDSMQARIFFARDNDYSFILPSKKKSLILCDFIHPALKNAIPCNINFKAKILLITGVNAGGKTMLLKSILSAAFLAKYLIPFRINESKSQIPYFKSIYAIINDPQDSKNDISTFAGRMLEFRKLLNIDNAVLGIDEIELGTDANEASALYLALLEHLEQKNIKIIITTHHKILASKMASNPNVALTAALYNEKLALPSYLFLEGSIGKSYAFESAKRYGIPPNIINRAKEVYGEDLENLSDLIEQTSKLKVNLLKKQQELDNEIRIHQNKNIELNNLIKNENEAIRNKTLKLESIYNDAISEAKALLKQNDKSEIHRFLNKQNKIFKNLPKEKQSPNIELKIGKRIMYNQQGGIILNLKKDIAIIELDSGIKMKVMPSKLELGAEIKSKPQKIDINKSSNSCNTNLDLHGKRAEEAIEILDKYISDCLLAGFDEVLIYHGIGSGILSSVVKEFLATHPKVKSFSDAPSNSGGFGAKVVKF